MEMWHWGALRCVLIHYGQPHGLALLVTRQGRVLARRPCADPDCAALEAERLYQVVSGERIDSKVLPEWLRKFRRMKNADPTFAVTRHRGSTR
jgi:hypothetical protein